MTVTLARPGAATRAAAAVALLASLLGGCATPPTDPAERAAFEQTNDPLEPTNRAIFDANMVFDELLMRPVAKVYVTIIPEEGRQAFRRVLDNLKEPVLVVNNVLQGRFDSAGISVSRFAINSTIGVVGLFDIAKKWGLDRQPADFGQTLYVWGLPEGPYLVLPVFGPSNPRDGIGMAVDAYMDPFNLLATSQAVDELQISRFVLDGIDQRARVLDVLDDLQRNSLDFYAQLRSLSRQTRAAELRHGEAPPPEPNFYDDPGKPAGGTPTPPMPASPAAAPTATNGAAAPAKPALPASQPAAAPAASAPAAVTSPAPKPAAGRKPTDKAPLRASAGP